MPKASNDTENIGKPDFSVIMANFNNAEFVSDAIESVINQSHTNWELIICDDASTDKSIEEINKYTEDPRIRLIENVTNIGTALSQNRLIKLSRSEYIGILDSDDVLDRNAVGSMLQSHEDNRRASFIYSQYIFCDTQLDEMSKGSCRKVTKGSSILVDDCAVAFRTFKKTYAIAVGGVDERMKYAEDKDFIYKLEEVGDVVFVDRELYLYRLQEQSSSHGSNMVKARSAMSRARLEAYKRRLNTSIPSISKRVISGEIAYGMGASIRLLDLVKLKTFMKAYIKYVRFSYFSTDPFIKGLLGKQLWL